MAQALAVPKPPRFHHSPENGWVVDTTIGLTRAEMIGAIDYVRKVQLKRAMQMPAGDRRDDILNALKDLTFDKIQQNLVSSVPWQIERYPFLKG